MPEIRIKHSDIQDPQTITPRMEREFAERGLNLHRHDVVELVDDFTTGERILKIRNTKYFTPT